MVHSVWDWKRLSYDYYTTPTVASVGGWKPLTGLGVPSGKVDFGVGGNPVGVDIEAVLPLLPSNAKHVGRGVVARGQVCARPSSGPVAGADGSTARMVDRSHLFMFLLGLSAGSLFGRVNPLMVTALTTSAFLTGINIAKDKQNDGAA